VNDYVVGTTVVQNNIYSSKTDHRTLPYLKNCIMVIS